MTRSRVRMKRAERAIAEAEQAERCPECRRDASVAHEVGCSRGAFPIVDAEPTFRPVAVREPPLPEVTVRGITEPRTIRSAAELEDLPLDPEQRLALASLFSTAPRLAGLVLRPEPVPNPATLAGETERVRVRLRDLRALLYALELALDDPAPPGPLAAQPVAHAAADLVGYVARLDLLRRNARR